jgi:serralysin
MCAICETMGRLSAGGTTTATSGFQNLGGPAATPPPRFSAAELSARIDTVLFELHDEVAVWHSASQPALAFTYAFETSQPADLWYGFTGWTAFTGAQKTAVRSAFDLFEEVINVRFVEVADSAPDPDINLGRGNLAYAGLGGFSYGFSTDGMGNVVSKDWDAFAFFGVNENLTDQDGMSLMLHEIGHALGLKHSGNYDVSGSAHGGPVLSAAEDSNLLTVMSYHDNPINGAISDRLMLLDIAALQKRYGANFSANSGDTIYTGDRTNRVDVIWDGAGKDTLSGASRSVQQTIDLREGAFSSMGATANVAIAYGAKIENAIGGAGDDSLFGNDLANELVGGDGKDTLAAGIGNDRISGETGNDTLYGQAGNDRIAGGSGNDILFGGQGRDSFVFSDALGAANRDRIRDFSVADDTIWLDSDVFTGLGDNRFLTSAAFKIISKGQGAIDADDRIIYDKSTGALFFDSDGDGGASAQVFATLSANLRLSAGDFFVF